MNWSPRMPIKLSLLTKNHGSYPRRARRSISRLRLPRSSSSSIRRPATSRLCSMPCSKEQCGSAERHSESYRPTTANASRWLPCGGRPPRYAEFRTSRTHVYGPGTVPARLLAGERLIQVLDITAEGPYRAGGPHLSPRHPADHVVVLSKTP